VSSPAGIGRRNESDGAQAPRARKDDRDEVFLEYTKSICPVCKVVVDGQVNVRDAKVYLRKRCREHGTFEALLYGDATMYVDSLRFNKPGPRRSRAARWTAACARSTSSTRAWGLSS
jgi:uncharacterized radical SAM superfamily Fe-S cluster-containing enzyme